MDRELPFKVGDIVTAKWMDKNTSVVYKAVVEVINEETMWIQFDVDKTCVEYRRSQWKLITPYTVCFHPL